MAKKVSVTKVVSTATVYGPTEIDEAERAISSLSSETKVFRSDYLDKLNVAITEKNPKYLVPAGNITFERPDTAKGINGDHPYVTFEKPRLRSEGTDKIYRSWRYLAIED